MDFVAAIKEKTDEIDKLKEQIAQQKTQLEKKETQDRDTWITPPREEKSVPKLNIDWEEKYERLVDRLELTAGEPE